MPEYYNTEGERLAIETREFNGKLVKCLVIYDDPPLAGGTGISAPMLLDEGTRQWLLEQLQEIGSQ